MEGQNFWGVIIVLGQPIWGVKILGFKNIGVKMFEGVNILEGVKILSVSKILGCLNFLRGVKMFRGAKESLVLKILGIHIFWGRSQNIVR